MLQALAPRHRPYDGRVQFITTAKKAGVDEHVIKKIVGHCIDDVAEKSYTKRGIESVSYTHLTLPTILRV